MFPLNMYVIVMYIQIDYHQTVEEHDFLMDCILIKGVLGNKRSTTDEHTEFFQIRTLLLNKTCDDTKKTFPRSYDKILLQRQENNPKLFI